jgi:hypothetical protein
LLLQEDLLVQALWQVPIVLPQPLPQYQHLLLLPLLLRQNLLLLMFRQALLLLLLMMM